MNFFDTVDYYLGCGKITTMKLKDKTGQRFGRLIVLGRGSFIGKRPAWLCLCDCGAKILAGTSNLSSGNTTSCGCFRKELLRNPISGHGVAFVDRTGERSGLLQVVGFAGKTERGESYWNCLCECGRQTKILGSNIKKYKSCGCFQHAGIHGHTKGGRNSSEYGSMAAMLQRCQNPKIPAYSLYGARGIKVCEEWDSLRKFPAFLKYMGPKPTLKHSIDRFPDKNGNYEPGNVRWATSPQQNRNQNTNVWFTYDGELICRTDLVKKYGICEKTFITRIRKGLSIDEALFLPDMRTKDGGKGHNPKFK